MDESRMVKLGEVSRELGIWRWHRALLGCSVVGAVQVAYSGSATAFFVVKTQESWK